MIRRLSVAGLILGVVVALAATSASGIDLTRGQQVASQVAVGTLACNDLTSSNLADTGA